MANLFIFTGRVAAAPMLTRPGTSIVTKFTLIRNENAGSTEEGEKRPDRTVSIQFTAFGKRAEVIAEHAMQGDQLEVTARVANNNYKKDGVDHYDINFIVEDFDFGAPGPAKREKLNVQQSGRQG